MQINRLECRVLLTHCIMRSKLIHRCVTRDRPSLFITNVLCFKSVTLFDKVTCLPKERFSKKTCDVLRCDTMEALLWTFLNKNIMQMFMSVYSFGVNSAPPICHYVQRYSGAINVQVNIFIQNHCEIHPKFFLHIHVK